MKWKILSSQYLFNDLWFKVRKDRCKSSSGKIIDPYYVYEFPDWVTAVALTNDEKVVMVRQYRHAAGEICIELPGGCIDSGEEPQKAIARELLEETGYSFSDFKFLGRISANPSTNNNWMHMFLATGGNKISDQKLDANEEINVELFTIDELKKLVSERAIIQAMHLSCILYALRELGLE